MKYLRLFLLLLFSIYLCALQGFSQPSGACIDRFWHPDGPVHALLSHEGILYLGGSFEYMGPRTGSAGLLEVESGQAAGPFPVILGVVLTAIPDGTGGWYIGGSFKEVDGHPISNLAHIRANAQLDPEWNPAPNGAVHALARIGDTLFVGGNFNSISGDSSLSFLAALEAATGAALRWKPNPNYSVNVFLVKDNVLYVGGDFARIQNTPRNRLASFQVLSETNALTSWAPSANLAVWTLAWSEEALYVGGEFTSIAGKPRNRIAALDLETGEALDWNPNANGNVRALVAGDNAVFAGGEFTSIGGRTRPGLAALDPLFGSTIQSWNVSVTGQVYSILLKGDQLYFGGTFKSVGGEERYSLAAVNAETGELGNWVPMISLLAEATIPVVRTLGDGGQNILAAGNFLSMGGEKRLRLAALDLASGHLLPWRAEADKVVRTLAVYTNLVLAGGNFTNINGAPRQFLAPLHPQSGELSDWDPNVRVTRHNQYSGIYSIAVMGNRIYLGGSFNKVGESEVYNAVAFDGFNASPLNWKPLPDGLVRCLCVLSNTVYMGGDFYSLGQTRRSYLAALSETGEVLEWNPAPDGVVRTMKVDPESMVIGGLFQNVGGEVRNRIAGLDLSNGTATGWNPDVGLGRQEINSIELAFKTVFVGGNFKSLGGEYRDNLGALNGYTGGAMDWNPAPNGSVHAILYDSGHVFVGGDFAEIAGRTNRYFAAFATAPEFTSDSPQMTNNQVRLRFADGGLIGKGYQVESSTDLATWQVLKTNRVAGRQVSYTDPSPVSTRKYYRVGIQ